MSEYLPKNQSLWLLFDLANGHKGGVRYTWWFDSRKEAIEHRKWQRNQRHSAKLSLPVKVRVV